MTPPSTRWLIAAVALVLAAASLKAAEEDSAPASPDRPKPEAEMWQERSSETRHTVRIGGEDVRYQATAGTLHLKEEDGTPKASVFFMAYTRDGIDDPSRRPVTFTFNGGPGSSSVWLHLGTFGPRRVDMGEEGWAPAPPGRLLDNPHSLLDVTDLVFIDPVMTGYSRPVPEQDKAQFHGVRQDIESVGELIRLWTTRNGRWTSPKLLAGESYGTTRAAGLVAWLQDRHGMYFNGVILVSAILDFGANDFDRANDLPYLGFLPSFAATAHYHGKLIPEHQNKDLEALVAEVEAFALGDYATALHAGDRLAPDARAEVRRRLAAYTGLSEERIEEWNLRIRDSDFWNELLRDDGMVAGRLDSRFRRPLSRPGEEQRGYLDPSLDAITGAYTAALNHYVRHELGFASDLPYEILTDRVHPWSFEGYHNRYVDVAAHLRGAMMQNPYLHVFVANGYYDLATPYFATEYVFDHLRLPPAQRSQVSMGYYRAGHMMYIREAELAALKRDLVRFYAAAIP